MHCHMKTNPLTVYIQNYTKWLHRGVNSKKKIPLQYNAIQLAKTKIIYIIIVELVE